VAVIGTGTIGLLAVMLAHSMSGEVTAVGIDPLGLDLALRVGAHHAVGSGEAPADEFSLVIEASGSSSGFLEAVRIARTGGRIAAVGVVSGPVPGFPAGEITLRGLSLHGIRHGLDHYDQTLKMFADGLLTADPLIHSRHPLTRPDEAFDALAQRSTGRPKVLLTTRS
jgi:threonine dehydrogenase-like Zn-dependent dehydrogenase